MKKKTNFYAWALATAMCVSGGVLTSCSDDPDPTPDGEGGGGTDTEQKVTSAYIVMSGSGENNGAYLQQVDSVSAGTLDATSDSNNRIFFSGNNPDFINYNNEILVGMNYPSQGGSSSDYVTLAWKLVDGKLTQHGSGVALDGDVKARGFYDNYLIGMSDQTEATDNGTRHYERVKFINVEDFTGATVDGIIECSDDMNAEPTSLMEGETWGVGDIAQYGDYVLLSYSTKHLEADAKTKAKATYSTHLANNFYLGVYKFDPADADKEYLKYQSTIVRKSADFPGKEAGQIKGNLRSRTESGIEVVDDKIYLFCQSAVKNYGKDAPEVPSAVLRISGSNIQNGMPVGIDEDYYVNLTEVTGHYMWKSFYLGDNKFCLQLFTEAGAAGVTEGSHKKFGIFDVATQSYTEVKGMPEPANISDIALAYAVDTDNHTISFEVQSVDGSKPAIYTITTDGTATRGLEVNTEAIQGISYLKQE
ncbi:DUF4374 domain-containing protein [uncultured Parabacteroides sp.]|uniref:DUF4374 domain-containing protein n=1 Tax=uncultured Parabacteroides sp. TaxID=512312 RepID=UPI002617F891|nr:DUF4374 domain-containing protein [uncultured Parabacteroides sp.]